MTDVKGPFTQNGTEAFPEQGDGRIILIDCNETMFSPAASPNIEVQKGLNITLLDFAIEAEKRGYKVYLDSADPSGNLSNYVPMYRRFFPKFEAFAAAREDRDEEIVIARGDLVPCRDAFITVNDEHGRGYNSGAQHQLLPTDIRFKATLEAWAKPKDAAQTAAPSDPNPLKF